MMTAPLRHSSGDPASPSQGKAGRKGTQMSHTKVLEPRSFRMRFAAHWSLFLQENYRNPEEVSVAFGVRYQTALNWWQGVNRPSGDVVALAFMQHPKRLPDFMRGQE